MFRKHGLITCGTGNNGTCEVRNISNISEIISKSSQSRYLENYLKVSTDINRPAQGVITQNGDLTLAVTFGKGLDQIKRGSDPLTYMYAACTRKLPSFYHSNRLLDEKKTLRLMIQLPSINDYVIYYKSSFQSNWMTYFVTNQKSVVGAKDYVSKLVRICQNDTGYNSYTDIAIQCTHDGVQYNLIQDAILLDRLESSTSSKVFVGAFTRGNDPENTMNDTVVCMAELQLLNDAIMAAKKDFATSCEDTDSATRYLSSHKERCINEKDYREQENRCENIYPIYRNVIGKTPYIMKSSFKVSQKDGVVTTLHGTVYNGNHLVLLLGTSTGKIIQIIKDLISFQTLNRSNDHIGTSNLYGVGKLRTILLEGHSIEEYGRGTVEGLYSIRKIHAEDDDTLYVLSSHAVTKYSFTRCSEYQTCADVMSSKNPLCGWCVYKERATRMTACDKASNHWLSSLRSCVSVSIEPSVISVDISAMPSNVTLKVQNIPIKMNGDRYSCRFISGFNLFKHVDVITVTKNTFSCEIPEISVHTEAKIEFLVKMQTGATAVLSSAHLLYFDCAFYRRCVDCISIKGVKCHWCSRSAACQEQNTCSMQPISDPTSYPKLLNTRARHFIHDRTSTTVAFRAANLLNDPSILYQCIVPGTNIQVEAYANSSSISCPLNVMKTDNKKKENFRIVVNYGPKGGQLAELNDDFLNFVTVYSCTYIATDCSHCQALNKTRYKCDWCKNSQFMHTNNSSCRSTQCPTPSITKVVPRNGSVRGGTHLTIIGTNLGINISNVEDITVAGIPCVLSNNAEDYQIADNQDFETFPPSRLTCTTQAAPKETIGMVNVTVDDQSSEVSIDFAYKIPIVTAIYPKFGPKAGGTRITLYGKNLGVGNRRVSVTLGGKSCLKPNVYPNFPLYVEVVDANYTIQCTVAGTYDEAIDKITNLCIKMDEGPFICTVTFYGFVADPTVTTVYPQTGFVSGGSSVNVEGKHLDNAHLAVIRLRYAGEFKKEKCQIVSSDRIICKVPNAPHTLKTKMLSLKQTATEASSYSIEVTGVLGLDGVKYNFTISYFRDPVIHSFTDDGDTVTLNPSYPHLKVNGEHLNLVATGSDIRITVGIETCALINLTSVSIICFAPASKPRSGIPDLENPEVNVTIGNIHKTVGYVRYLEEDNKIVSIVISTVAVLVVMVMVFICGFYRRIKKKSRRIERPKDGIEMTELPRKSSRYSRAGSGESEDIYADISDDGMHSYNEEIEEDRIYDKPEEYLEFRPHLRTNERATQILLTERVKLSKGSVCIHPSSDDSLHRLSLANYNKALLENGDTDGAQSVQKESHGSVYIYQSSHDFHGFHDFLHRTSPKVNGTSLSKDIHTCFTYKVVRKSTSLPQDLDHSNGFNGDCLSNESHENNKTELPDDGDEQNTRIVQRKIVKESSDYDHPCNDDSDGNFLHRSILGKNDTTLPDGEDGNNTHSILRETASEGLNYIHPYSKDTNDDNLLRPVLWNELKTLSGNEDASVMYRLLRETTKMSQSSDYIHPCSNDLDNDYQLRSTLNNKSTTLLDDEDRGNKHSVLKETAE